MSWNPWKRASEAEREVVKMDMELWDAYDRISLLETALRRIIRQETPHANATTRRMADIAREVLQDEN